MNAFVMLQYCVSEQAHYMIACLVIINMFAPVPQHVLHHTASAYDADWQWEGASYTHSPSHMQIGSGIVCYVHQSWLSRRDGWPWCTLPLLVDKLGG